MSFIGDRCSRQVCQGVSLCRQLLFALPERACADPSHAPNRRTICDPYAEYGVLNVSLETPRENVWQPVAAEPECQPTNWVEMIAQAERSRANDPRLDHLRHRTVVVYGDSIDRDHVEDVCAFVGGRHEMIHDQHPLSPPYPQGEELPPPGYQNPITGERTWLQNGQSRPWICHIPQLDTRIINVFHFGFQDISEFLLSSPHYYPPARIEGRHGKIPSCALYEAYISHDLQIDSTRLSSRSSLPLRNSTGPTRSQI